MGLGFGMEASRDTKVIKAVRKSTVLFRWRKNIWMAENSVSLQADKWTDVKCSKMQIKPLNSSNTWSCPCQQGISNSLSHSCPTNFCLLSKSQLFSSTKETYKGWPSNGSSVTTWLLSSHMLWRMKQVVITIVTFSSATDSHTVRHLQHSFSFPKVHSTAFCSQERQWSMFRHHG